MTDDEIKKFEKFLDEFEDKLKRYKCGKKDLPIQLHKDLWNRAIEKAASVADTSITGDYCDSVGNNIRKLKV